MRSVVVTHSGGPEVLVVQEIETPIPGVGEVLIRVSAAGINRADVHQRQGFYPAPPGAPETLGLEVSGHIAALGDGVTSLAVGQRICALLPGGGYAEFAIAAASHVLPIPNGMIPTDAAGILEATATVWSNLFRFSAPPKGSWILIHGGTSGIGTYATQIASALGYKVVTTCGSEEKIAASLAFGATLAINYKDEDFVDRLHREDIRAALILDHVGGSNIARNIDVLALDGHIVSIGNLSGEPTALDLGALMRVRGTLSSSSLRARSSDDKAALLGELRTFVWPLFENGVIHPVTHATFTLEEAPEAHRLMESSEHIGKILLLA